MLSRKLPLRGPSHPVHGLGLAIIETRKISPLTCNSIEPPIGIEPMTYALRGELESSTAVQAVTSVLLAWLLSPPVSVRSRGVVSKSVSTVDPCRGSDDSPAWPRRAGSAPLGPHARRVCDRGCLDRGAEPEARGQGKLCVKAEVIPSERRPFAFRMWDDRPRPVMLVYKPCSKHGRRR